ncbi:MAG TPA: hypothetical protein DDZ89_19195, partial [Clostridiales bacterium]|nr:hypothetical protein [Clostridiales bacterium]
MKNLKRVILGLLIVVMMVNFAACQKTTGQVETEVTTTVSQIQTQSETQKEYEGPKAGEGLENLGLVAVKSFYTEPFELLRILEVLKYEFDTGIIDGQTLASRLETTEAYLAGTDYYYEYIPFLNVSVDNGLGGIIPSEDPVGGGKGYKDVIKKGDYNVKTADELVEAVEKAKTGDVIFVDSNAKIDMTDFCFANNYIIKLKEGVTLASDRGRGDSSGGMIYTTAIRSTPLIQAEENCRITGITIQGPDPKIRDWKGMSSGTGISTKASNVIVDNCEISGFNKAAVELEKGTGHVVKNCYIHDNKSINVGYGVSVESAHVLIENNLFNNNRNSVYGRGKQDCGMEVGNNIEMGTAFEECVKMDTYKRGSEVLSGEYLIVRNNTYITNQTPLFIENMPVNERVYTNNYFAGSEGDYAELFEKLQTNGTVENNAFGLSEKVPSTEKRESAVDFASKHKFEMRVTNITSRNIYGDMEKAYIGIQELASKITAQKVTKDEISQTIVDIVRDMEGYDRAYDYLENPNMTIDGKIYGAIPDDQPLGGGYGYKEVFTTGDYVVETAEELIDALAKAKSGETVFVKGNAVIDLTTVKKSILINDGVTLASDRGNNNSPGALIYSDAFFSPMFTTGANVRVSGLTFRGADPELRLEHHRRSYSVPNAPGSTYYYKLLTLDCITTAKNHIEVDNCEFSGFSHAAVYISGGVDHYFHHN